MQNQNPAIIRAAAFKIRFFAHAPQVTTAITPIVAEPEIETTPATQLEVETYNAHCEYLQLVNYYIFHPAEETDDASDEIARRKSRWQRLKAELDAEATE